jgi:hypothetical protein
MIKTEIKTFRSLQKIITCCEGHYIELATERLKAHGNALAGERFFVNHPHRDHRRQL